jgi:hypothetical protein
VSVSEQILLYLDEKPKEKKILESNAHFMGTVLNATNNTSGIGIRLMLGHWD